MLVLIFTLLLGACGTSDPPPSRPNILWLSSEDNGPELGCYGDSYATTPSIDGLAARGIRYHRAWSTAPVCASARTTLITGSYATTFGAHHHRSRLAAPAGLKFFPQYLREAGYYCSNNSKEDYNIAKPGQVWDESSNKAHWRKRAPDQPFFAVFNVASSHESRIRKRPHSLVHDPMLATIPPYHPDLPEVRHDWAQYYDQLTVMDTRIGVLLKQLEEDGLAEDTIIFYFGDHGSGMPRHKRWTGDTGLRVPLIVVIPDKFKHLRPSTYAAGGLEQRLVSFVDFGATVLSLAGLKPPVAMQGRAFLGEEAQVPRTHLYGFRGRMDERTDMVRSITDGRYLYMRSYLPDLPHGQHVGYQFETPTTAVWKAAFDAGELNPTQSRFWQPRAREELYDLEQDPFEVHDLASSPEHHGIRDRLAAALHHHLIATGDLGFLPEADMLERLESGLEIPVEALLRAAERASDPSLPEEELVAMIEHADAGVRWWGVQGLGFRGAAACRRQLVELRRALADDSLAVRVAAADLLVRYASSDLRAAALDLLCRLADGSRHPYFISLEAWNRLDLLGSRVAPQRARLAALPAEIEGLPRAFASYLPRLRTHMLAAEND